MIDTYDADDIWGVCLWRRKLPSGGKHKLHITVAGEKQPDSTGTSVYIDGIQIRH